MPNAVFAYGTLMVPEIWQAVTQIPLTSSPLSGVLRGYQRRRVDGADFPGIFASGHDNDVVVGCIYDCIHPDTYERLDRYEDEFYHRVEVRVETEATPSSAVPCQTYIVPAPAVGILSDEDWDLGEFRARALNRYLEALGVKRSV